MNILLFLTYWSVRVVEWFASLYDRGREIVINFWNYLIMTVSQAVQAAIAVAQSLLSGVYNTVQGWINSIWAYLGGLVSQILSWVNSTVSNIYNWIMSQVYAIRDWLVGLYYQAIGFINSIYPWVQGIINSALQGLMTWVLNQFNWVLGLYSFLMNLLSIFSPVNIQKFLDFLGRIYPELVLFLQNPIYYILDLIKDKFISFFCAVIAYGFGTTKYELPPFMSWKNR